MPENLVWSGTNYNGIDYKITTDGDLSDIIIDNATLYAINPDPDVPNIYNSAIYNGSGVGWRGVIITKTPMNFHQYYYWGGTWREESGNSFSCSRLNNTVYERSDRNIVAGLNIYENFAVGTNGTTTYSYVPQFNEGDEAAFRAYVASPQVIHQWYSASAISGKNGILTLPVLFTEPTDGEPVTGADIYAFNRLPAEADLRRLYSNIVFNEEHDIIWSGNDAKATVTWTSATAFTIKLYIEDLTYPFYTINYTLGQAANEVFVAFLYEVVGDNEWIGRPSFIIRDAVTGLYGYNLETTSDEYYEQIGLWLRRSYSGEAASLFGEVNDEEGGDDYSTLEDDPILNPPVPTIGALATGFTRVYYVTGANKSKISDLMDWFNDDDLQFINQIFKGDPMQALIGINISPLALSATGHPNIKFLGIDTGIQSDGVITDQFQEIDCGEINIDMWMKDTYLDFAPYTKIKAVLPYVGAMDLNVDDLKYKLDSEGKKKKGGATLSLKYVIDCLTGACVAHLFVDGSLHYEASGSCYISVPLTQKDYTSEMNAIKGAVSNVAESLIKGAGLAAMGVGGAGTIVAGMAATAVSSGLNVAAQHPDIRYIGGNTGAVTGYMGIDRPFLLVEQPILARPANDEHYFGMPSYIEGTIGSFKSSGNQKPQFARFSDVHLENIDCTESERADILQALTNGVMIDDGSAAPDTTPLTAGNKVIVLLHNKSEHNTIGKTFANAEGTVLKIEGNNFFDQSISSPVFIIEASDVYTYNYAYVPTLHRYYYITDIVALKNNLLELHMQVDALQSFKEEIKACRAICARSEWKTNYLINDGAMMVQQPQQVATLQFVKNNAKFSFTRASAGFVIIVASGT